MDVCLLLSVVRYRSLRQADHSSRGILLTVVRRCVWYRNLIYEEPNISHLWLTLNRRYITGCISSMPLIVTVKHDCWMSSDRLQCTGRQKINLYSGPVTWLNFRRHIPSPLKEQNNTGNVARSRTVYNSSSDNLTSWHDTIRSEQFYGHLMSPATINIWDFRDRFS